MKLTYPACFYPCEQKRRFASGWVLDELEDGKTVPPASLPEAVVPDAGGFVSMLVRQIMFEEQRRIWI